jgi:glycosyltransferase involved in cell wall biosynthesis
MNIHFVSSKDPFDIHSWSGTIFHMRESLLKHGHNLSYHYPLNYDSTDFRVRLRKRYHEKVSGKKYILERDPRVCRRIASEISIRLKPGTDIVFSPGTLPVSLLETDIPIVFYTDATFAGMLEYYDPIKTKELGRKQVIDRWGTFSNLCAASIRNGHLLEKKALERCRLAIYSCDWAASSAIKDYGADPEKVKVVPFGTNMDRSPNPNEVSDIIASRSKNECHLLFLGVDWINKGGDVALETTRLLNEAGVKAYLHVVGIRKFPFEERPPYLIDHGFISKREQSGKDQIEAFLRKCHFMILPTLADCTPMVFGEANAFGMPVVTNEVGGITTLIRDDVNGLLFRTDSPPAGYAERIMGYWKDSTRYVNLCLSSQHEYATRLNWDVAGRHLHSLIAGL